MDSTPFIELLKSLIQVSSLSGDEDQTASILADFLAKKNILYQRLHNNIIARNRKYKDNQPIIVLNSHHDTVVIGNGWNKDPLGGVITDGKLYGRGSNDAGGALVGLIAAFCHYYDHDLPYNLILIASGEEENFGKNGVSSVLNEFNIKPDLAIIGEPTSLDVAIAEKGLIVIDGITKGKSGHAARDIGINALYLAIEDIHWIKNFIWEKVSEVLGPVKTTVTQIEAGSQHNVIPDQCKYVIDCRVNEKYSLQEVLDILDRSTHATLTPRSLKWHPSGIDKDHPIVKKALSIGLNYFGSPTLSDQVHFSCPSIKMGPGDSERSHIPDEYISTAEIIEGINKYIALLDGLKLA